MSIKSFFTVTPKAKSAVKPLSGSSPSIGTAASPGAALSAAPAGCPKLAEPKPAAAATPSSSSSAAASAARTPDAASSPYVGKPGKQKASSKPSFSPPAPKTPAQTPPTAASSSSATGASPSGADGGIEMKEDTSFTSYFKTLPVVDSLVRLFDMKTHYCVYGEDARFVAQEYHKSLRHLKKFRSGLDYLCIRPGMEFESVLSFLLTVRQRRVQLLENRATNSSRSDWAVVKKASPGNVSAFESEVFAQNEQADSPVFMAVYAAQEAGAGGGGGGAPQFGVAFADTTLRYIGVAQFADTEQLANLESVLVQVGVKECCALYDEKSYLHSRVADLVERCEIPLMSKKKTEFRSSDVEQDLTRLLGTVKNILPCLDQKLAMAACSCLINHLELLGDRNNHGQYRFKTFDLNQYMKLDSAALRALNVVPQPNETGTLSQGMNLQSFLNQCRTAMGSRKLGQFVRQPLMSRERIEERLDMVSAFYEDTLLRQSVRDECLRSVPDIDRLCRRVATGRASLQDLVVLYQVAIRLDVALEALREYSGRYLATVERLFVEKLVCLTGDLKNYVGLIEAAVDLDKIEQHLFVVQPGYSEELTRLDKKRQQYYDRIQKLPEEVADLFGLKESKLKLEFQNNHGGWHFRVSRTDEKTIRDKLKGQYRPFDTGKQGVRFRGDMLKALNEKYQKYAGEFDLQQREIVEKVMKVAATYLPVFSRVGEQLAALDVFAAWAHVAAGSARPYVRPTLADARTGDTVIRAARHPCLERQDGVQFIPNDVVFRRDQSRFQIVTGVNMGGKSTYIRTAGLVVLMAQMGCFVPADSAQISLTDCILARVGAGDSQLRGVSTFMAEMLETAHILDTATESSFVIIDELGRGTSTYDGFGLAWAISEHLATNVRCFSFFATHFHELAALAEQAPAVKNLHVEAKLGDELTMLYKVQDGPSDQSLGIHVAVMAKFPEAVVRVAKRKAEVLDGIEARAAELEAAVAQPDDEAGALPASVFSKRVRTAASEAEQQEGLQLVQTFLGNVRALQEHQQQQQQETIDSNSNNNPDGAGGAALTKAISPLIADLQASSNPFVRDLLRLATKSR